MTPSRPTSASAPDTASTSSNDLAPDRSADRAGVAVPRSYSVLIGIAALAVFLQGLWAGIFIQEGKDFQQTWVEVHARCADAAILLAAAASVVALVRLRARRDLLIGTIAFTVLLVLEAFLGGLIGDLGRMTIVHIPLAMGLMALAVWLPLRARRR